MRSFTYSDSSFDVRSDLKQAHRAYWDMLAEPGNWWTGAERVAIAEEVRNATSCAFCPAVSRPRAASTALSVTTTAFCSPAAVCGSPASRTLAASACTSTVSRLASGSHVLRSSP